MLHSVKKLVECKRSRVYGNHSVCIDSYIRKFGFFGHIVCYVNDLDKTFHTDYCGYDNSVSTKRTIHDYETYFRNKGYREV